MVAQPDLLTLARTCIAASTVTSDAEAGVFYIASARRCIAKLADELRAIELLVTARESELARRGMPKQLAMEPTT